MSLPWYLDAPIRGMSRSRNRVREWWRERGWEQLSFAQYSEAFDRLGGSLATHPQLLSLFEELTGRRVRFLGLERAGSLVAAIPVWDGEVAVSTGALWRHGLQDYLDIGDGEVVVPAEPGAMVRLPCKARMLSALHHADFSDLRVSTKYRFMLVHGGDYSGVPLSKGFVRKYRRKLQILLESGGRQQPVVEIPPDELARVYRELFFRRWGSMPRGSAHLPVVFDRLRELLRGFLLWRGPDPVALTIVFAHPSPRGLLAVAVNGGFDPQFGQFSPGSVLDYLNTIALEREALDHGVQMRYCLGKDDTDYKKLWCYEQSGFEWG